MNGDKEESNPVDEILSKFIIDWRFDKAKDDLREALEAFYKDVRSSFELAGATKEQLKTVDDYVANHYL